MSGKGLMLGREATLTILPAPPDSGIVFERTDLERPVIIPALVSNVVPNARRTTLKAGDVTIETVEHCLSALRGMGIDNALLRLSGPELPCGDGSAMPFVDAIRAAGVAEQDAPRRMFRLAEMVTVEEGDASITAIPAEGAGGMRVMYDLDYGPNATRIPHQAWSFDPSRDDYVNEIAPARTFYLKEEAEALWQAGLCRHLTPRDVLVIGEDGPIQNEYRFREEPVRHKVLDLVGDLALVGRPVHAHVRACRSGHRLNGALAARLGAAGALRGSAAALKDLEKRQKSRQTRSSRDALDRALIDLATYFRDALMVAGGAGAVTASHPDMTERVAALAAYASQDRLLRCIEAVLACREALAMNVKPKFAVGAMVATVGQALRTGG